jgi:hypothetical protein
VPEQAQVLDPQEGVQGQHADQREREADPKEAGPAELARLSLPIAAGFRRRPG